MNVCVPLTSCVRGSEAMYNPIGKCISRKNRNSQDCRLQDENSVDSVSNESCSSSLLFLFVALFFLQNMNEPGATPIRYFLFSQKHCKGVLGFGMGGGERCHM